MDKLGSKKGFTIVEIVVVIVIIGILAAITVVSYVAITDDAKQQAIMADAQATGGLLSKYKATNGRFPAELSDLPSAPSAEYTYQYTYKASDNTYCLTASSDDSSAYITSSQSKPRDGACAGHGANGEVAVVNLVPNPSAEKDLSNLNGYYAPKISRVTAAGASGGAHFRAVTVGSTTYQGIMHIGVQPAKPSYQYTCSMSFKGTAGTVIQFSARFATAANTHLTEGVGMKQVTLTGSWQRVSSTFTTTATTGIVRAQYRTASMVSGVTIDSDALMCTEGATVYKYADGNTPGWAWFDAPNASRSSGPALP